ncbi:MAG: single-stranded DNA-binding protein [Ignavibacteria bacterium]|jgi:single-strand DNA-binding protein|nr:single-stranded DNA-binding protein [Ignavibacteria bacterium]
MSRTLNKVMLIGNVGKDPELKHTPSGIPVVSFNLATTDSWKDRSGNLQEHTDWHTIVAWRGLAEICQKLVKKGARIYIEGKLQTRKIEDKNGNRKHIVEILADNMLLLDGKKNKDDQDYSQPLMDNDSDNIDDFQFLDFDDDSFLTDLSDKKDKKNNFLDV